jgi:hypothetical protein
LTTRFDDDPEFAPDDPLAVILRPPAEHLGPPSGRYEAIRRAASRRRLLRTAAGVGVTCAVAALIALPLHLTASTTPTSPAPPLAPPPASSPTPPAAPSAVPTPSASPTPTAPGGSTRSPSTRSPSTGSPSTATPRTDASGDTTRRPVPTAAPSTAPASATSATSARSAPSADATGGVRGAR